MYGSVNGDQTYTNYTQYIHTSLCVYSSKPYINT